MRASIESLQQSRRRSGVPRIAPYLFHDAGARQVVSPLAGSERRTMIARRLGTALCVVGSVVAAAVLSAGCDTMAGGGGGGNGWEPTAEQLEVNPALQIACTGISDSEIEAILQEVAEQRRGGMSSSQAAAQSAITCATSPPGG